MYQKYNFIHISQNIRKKDILPLNRNICNRFNTVSSNRKFHHSYHFSSEPLQITRIPQKVLPMSNIPSIYNSTNKKLIKKIKVEIIIKKRKEHEKQKNLNQPRGSYTYTRRFRAEYLLAASGHSRILSFVKECGVFTHIHDNKNLHGACDIEAARGRVSVVFDRVSCGRSYSAGTRSRAYASVSSSRRQRANPRAPIRKPGKVRVNG